MSDLDYQLGDSFDDAVRPAAGWADRQWFYRYEVAGQQIVDSDLMPLPLLPSLTHEEMVELHYALAMADDRSHVYRAVRHMYLGVPIVTVAVSVGQPGWGDVRTEEYDGSDRFIDFAVECRKPALHTLSTVGRKMVSELADRAMADVLKMLKAKERGYG